MAFPTNPTEGSTHTENGRPFTYTSGRWQRDDLTYMMRDSDRATTKFGVDFADGDAMTIESIFDQPYITATKDGVSRALGFNGTRWSASSPISADASTSGAELVRQDQSVKVIDAGSTPSTPRPTGWAFYIWIVDAGQPDPTNATAADLVIVRGA